MRKYGDEIDKMQQDAVRRMQEMQSRGKTGDVNKGQAATSRNEVRSATDAETAEEPKSKPIMNKHNSGDIKSDNSFFDVLFNDKERSLILLLLILLSSEKTDAGLILALVYLLI